MNMYKQNGFTLIEIVIVMIVSSLLIIPLANGLTSSSKSMILNNEVNQANNLAKSCAEYILHKRKKGDYTANGDINATDCDGVSNFATNGTLSSTLIATGTSPCPGTADPVEGCSDVTVTALNDNNETRSQLKLLFVY